MQQKLPNVILILLLSAVIIAGCATGEAEPDAQDLVDGTYEGASDASPRGYAWSQVVISGGEITAIELKEFRGDGSEKTPDNYDYEPWAEAVEQIPQAMIEAQSADVDAVAGATSSSALFSQAVRRALGEEEDLVGPFTDGVHEGFSDPGPRGYLAVNVVVQRGTITNVQMSEFRGDGSEKTPDNYDYEPWLQAAEDLPQAALEAQSANVDTVADATSTSNQFRQAMARALGEEPAVEFGPYEDGIHVARSDLSGRGGYVEAEVTVLLGRIVAVSFEEYQPDGEAKTPDNYDFEPWLQAYEELPGAVVDAQSADVDAIADATSTSNMFRQAVRRALGEEEELAGHFTDGVHEGFSDPGPRGYLSVEVVVEGGTITDVQMMEFRGDGSQKTPENYDFEPWLQAAEELPGAVVDAQSADVDAIAGATSTSNMFLLAMARALGEEPAFEHGPYKDGTYEARSDESERGGYVEAEVTVLLGRIVAVSFEEYQADGEAKTPDNYDFEPWLQAYEELPGAVVDAQSADVDAIADATSTSNMFRQAVERALDDAS